MSNQYGSPPSEGGFVHPKPGTSPKSEHFVSSPNSKKPAAFKSHVVKSILLNRSNSGSLPTMVNKYISSGSSLGSSSGFASSGTASTGSYDEYSNAANHSPEMNGIGSGGDINSGSGGSGNNVLHSSGHISKTITEADDKGGKTDKSLWTARALKEHPEIADVYDRIKPINRCISLGQHYAYEETLLKDDPLIGADTILQLIIQHLQYEGLNLSKKSLEEEMKSKYPDNSMNESRLVTLIRTALKDSERIFGLTLDERVKDSSQNLEEHLAFMGLLYEEPNEVEDGNIYDEPETNILYVEEKDLKNLQQIPPDTTNPPPNGVTSLTSSTSSVNTQNTTSSLSNSSTNIVQQQQPSLGTSISNGSIGGMGQSSPLGMSTGLSSMNLHGGIKEEPIKAIKAASLNKLVILLTPEKNHDLEYTRTFLLTYQSFTTPEKLLQKLIQRYQVPQKAGQSDDEWRKIAIPIQLRVVNVIKNWIKDNFSDFNDKLIQTVKAFCENLRREGNSSHSVRIMTTLNSKIKGGGEDDDEDKKIVFKTPAPEPKVPKNIWSQNLDIFDIDEEEIARQLTLIDFEMFIAIKPSELLNQSWNKPKLKHRSPNVLALINRFNEISTWTASTILSFDRVKDRSRVMAKFIKIAEFLFKPLNNFNTCMAILSGLNLSSVHRLKFTKEEMPKHTQQVYSDLSVQLHSAQSYKLYREILSKANPPLVPYLGVCLTDLTFMEEANPDMIQNFINFSKRKLIYSVISTVIGAQYTRYNLQPVYQISKLLRTLKPRFDEEDLYRRSLKYEPRNKERNEIL